MTLTTWQFTLILLKTLWFFWVIGAIGLLLVIKDTIKAMRRKRRVYRVEGRKKQKRPQGFRLARVFTLYSRPRLPKDHWRPNPRALLHLRRAGS